jgi:succinate dehydrogenase / fumarate reductase cytochrome b subunit
MANYKESQYKRPLSPHLQIYNIFSKEMTSGMSILHRIAEVGIALALFYMLAWLLAISIGQNAYNIFLSFITSWFGILSLVGISACFWFYIFNIWRFIAFYLGLGINKKAVMYTGWLSLILSFLGLILTWLYVFKTYYM